MLRPESILQPMLALGVLTFLVLLRIPFVRIRAARAGQVRVDDFKLGESARVPPDVALPNRNYMNLLELPTLFYAACLGLLVLNKVSEVDYTIAWVYVALRVAHSFVHLSYNNVLHRLVLFAASNVVLGVFWLRLSLAVG